MFLGVTKISLSRVHLVNFTIVERRAARERARAACRSRILQCARFKVDGESSLSGIIAASLLLDAGLFLEAGSLVRAGLLVRASLLLRSGLLLHASLLRLRFLARDFLEHYFHPLAAHCDPWAAVG